MFALGFPSLASTSMEQGRLAECDKTAALDGLNRLESWQTPLEASPGAVAHADQR